MYRIRYPQLFLVVVMIIVLLLTVDHFLKIVLIKYFVYGIELTYLLFLFFKILSIRRLDFKSCYASIVLFVFLIVLKLVINDQNRIDDILKLFGAIIVYCSGYLFIEKYRSFGRLEKVFVYFISWVPVIVLLVDRYYGYSYALNSMSIFWNSNNYMLYVIVCVWLMLVFNVNYKIIILYFIINIFLGSTLGVFISLAISLFYYYRQSLFRLNYLFVLIFSIFLLFVFDDLYGISVIAKLKDNYLFFKSTLGYSLSDFEKMSFADALRLAGDIDGDNLSFLFRIKIWTEILYRYVEGGVLVYFFGYGFGSIPSMNEFGLVAHNDYLTWLVEGGAVFLIFILLVFIVGFRKIKKTVYVIPYMTVVIYLFSENLYFNYLAVMIFSYAFGATVKYIECEDIANQ